MMINELPKKDKRLCREFIHKGLEQECEKFVKSLQRAAGKAIPLEELNAPYSEENGWSVEGPWHKRYIQLFKMMKRFDSHVADRYDNATGSHYLEIVEDLYFDGWLTDDDIKQFSEETRQDIERTKLLRETFQKNQARKK